MGVKANILLIGPFKKNIAGNLSYPEDFYSKVEENTLVVTENFHCVSSDASLMLADALGVFLWNFNTHRIDPNKINWEVLYEMYEQEDVDNVRRLFKEHFVGIFMPNG